MAGNGKGHDEERGAETGSGSATGEATASALLPLPAGCVLARLVRREKRFTVYAEGPDGEQIAAHCNNSGSMLGLMFPGCPVLLSPADKPGRKLKWTLEMVRPPAIEGYGDSWVGVNTLTPNRLLAAAWRAGRLEWAKGFASFRPETRHGNSRFDACLHEHEDGTGKALWVEAKNVTMVEDGGVAGFPDAVTERGRKHLEELTELAKDGVRASVFFAVQRPDGMCFGPADYVDPAFAETFWRAVDAGVSMHPHLVQVTQAGIDLGPVLPLAPRSD